MLKSQIGSLTALENLETEVDVNKAWEAIRENIRVSAKESLIGTLTHDEI